VRGQFAHRPLWPLSTSVADLPELINMSSAKRKAQEAEASEGPAKRAGAGARSRSPSPDASSGEGEPEATPEQRSAKAHVSNIGRSLLSPTLEELDLALPMPVADAQKTRVFRQQGFLSAAEARRLIRRVNRLGLQPYTNVEDQDYNAKGEWIHITRYLQEGDCFRCAQRRASPASLPAARASTRNPSAPTSLTPPDPLLRCRTKFPKLRKRILALARRANVEQGTRVYARMHAHASAHANPCWLCVHNAVYNTPVLALDKSVSVPAPVPVSVFLAVAMSVAAPTFAAEPVSLPVPASVSVLLSVVLCVCVCVPGAECRTPSTLHPTPCTLRPASCTLHRGPETEYAFICYSCVCLSACLSVCPSICVCVCVSV